MESLPEEILDHVLSFVTINYHDRTIPDIQSLRNVSIVSQRLQRMSAPHLFRAYNIDQACVDGRRHLIQVQPALLRYTVELHVNDNVDYDALALKIAQRMPNVRVLDITVANRRVRHENEADFWNYPRVYPPIHYSYYRASSDDLVTNRLPSRIPDWF
jgi:hypothetical protein